MKTLSLEYVQVEKDVFSALEHFPDLVKLEISQWLDIDPDEIYPSLNRLTQLQSLMLSHRLADEREIRGRVYPSSKKYDPSSFLLQGKLSRLRYSDVLMELGLRKDTKEKYLETFPCARRLDCEECDWWGDDAFIREAIPS